MTGENSRRVPKVHQKRYVAAARYHFNATPTHLLHSSVADVAPSEIQMIGALLDEIDELNQQLGRLVMEHG